MTEDLIPFRDVVVIGTILTHWVVINLKSIEYYSMNCSPSQPIHQKSIMDSHDYWHINITTVSHSKL